MDDSLIDDIKVEPDLNCHNLKAPIEILESYTINIDEIEIKDEKPYKCDICFKAFKSNCSLIFHERTHRKNNEVAVVEIVEISSKNLTDSDFLSSVVKDPLKLEEDENENEDENDDENGFDYKSDTDEDTDNEPVPPLTDEDKKSLKCPICKKDFKNFRYLENHYKATHDKTITIFKCSFCNKSFKRKSQCRDHELNHLNEKTNKCSCSIGFNTRQQLLKHQKKTNHKPIPELIDEAVKETGIECAVCKNIFKTRAILKHHVREVHEKFRRFKCPVEGCDGAFTRKAHLKTHTLYLHSDDRFFKCTECEKSFKQKRDLQAHQMIHSGIKNFTCKFCFKKFNTESNLRTHLATHSEKLKCSFPHCSREFSYKYSLKNHEKYQHKGAVKTHICHICEMGFVNANGLKCHSFTHLDVRSFKCELCPKSYKHYASLLGHEKVHFTRVKVKKKN